MKPVRLHNISETGAAYTKALIQTNNVFLSAYKSALKPYEDAIRQGNKLTNFETLQYAATQVYFPNRRAIALIEKRYLGQITKEESAELDGIEEFYPYKIPMDLVRKEKLNDITSEEKATLDEFRREKIEYKLYTAPYLNDHDLELVLFKLGFNKF